MSKKTRRRLDAASKGESSAGGFTERDRCPAGGEISAHPHQIYAWKEVAARRRGRGFLRRVREGGEPRGSGHRVLREDRRADSKGTEFASAFRPPACPAADRISRSDAGSRVEMLVHGDAIGSVERLRPVSRRFHRCNTTRSGPTLPLGGQTRPSIRGSR